MNHRLWLRIFQSSSPPKGWTLIEISTIAVIAGILGSLALPSLMGIQARMALRSNVTELKQALHQAQRNAIKMGKECRLIMNTSSNPPRLQLDSDPDYVGCLPFQELLLPNTVFHENFPGSAIRFSFKGNSTNLGTMVLESPQAGNHRYCIVMSNFIGMIRSGSYKVAPPTPNSVSHSHCEAEI